MINNIYKFNSLFKVLNTTNAMRFLVVQLFPHRAHGPYLTRGLPITDHLPNSM